MKILVLNAGSSSQKSGLYDIPDVSSGGDLKQSLEPVWEAQIDWLPQENAAQINIVTSAGESFDELRKVSSRKETLSYLLKRLSQSPTKVLDSLEEIDAVGHRVVHGGKDYQSSTLITPEVKATIDRLSELAPNHNPANLEGIVLMEQLLADVPQVAVFDTAFHSQMPQVASTYPGPYDWLAQGIRRYGFHGISHQFCAQRAAQLLGQDLASLRLIICHLGNGGSLSAVRDGRSIDTTMGFTPLEGLMMGTRSGTVDPGILIHLMRQGMPVDELDKVLNKQSGLLGISGVSHDLREIEKAVEKGDVRAQLAKDLYLHRLKACLGAMLMSLGGIDGLVFTAGIGEHSPWVRAAVCEAMAFLGVEIDLKKNQNSPVDEDIATADSKVRVLVIHTQEDWAIAQACWSHLQAGKH
ncbi:MAG: acetate kinase [Cyanobacteria bacterium J06554_11]